MQRDQPYKVIINKTALSNKLKDTVNKSDSDFSLNTDRSDINFIKKQKQNYRKKYELALTKCQIMQKKLEQLGHIQDINDQIMLELSQTQKKMTRLQQIFDTSSQENFKYLKRNVCQFLNNIDFSLRQQDIKQVKTEGDVIELLLNLFIERYTELMNERQQFSQIISEQKVVIQKLQYAFDMQKKQLQKLNNNGNGVNRSKTLNPIDYRNKALENQIQQLKQQIFQLTQLINEQNEQFQRERSEKQQMNLQIHDFALKIKILESQIEKFERNQARWKSRYEQMERQKAQKIRLLEDELLNRNDGEYQMVNTIINEDILKNNYNESYNIQYR